MSTKVRKFLDCVMRLGEKRDQHFYYNLVQSPHNIDMAREGVIVVYFNHCLDAADSKRWSIFAF